MLVLCGSSSIGSVCRVILVGVGVAWPAFIVSCLMASGVHGVVCMGMFGQVVAKHLGCHDSPWLCVLRTRHSRPTRSWLQTAQVSLVRGTRCGCMVVYSCVGRTMLRRRRLVVILVLPLLSMVGGEGGPGCDASPMRTPRSPYRAFRLL